VPEHPKKYTHHVTFSNSSWVRSVNPLASSALSRDPTFLAIALKQGLLSSSESVSDSSKMPESASGELLNLK